MKKNLRVVQINGFRGLFLALFIVSCLIAGFIAFPSFIAMHTWNYLATKTGSFPSIDFAASLLLWGIIAFSTYLCTKKKFIVSMNTQQELSDDEIREVISKFKSQTINPQMLLPKDFSKDIKEEIKDENVEQKVEQNVE